ncbi:MAG: hypothetical protein KDC98_11610, partial [Planctomycetes bacterium]|nr:hypothetical protein [Planctomycetota bacterium]
MLAANTSWLAEPDAPPAAAGRESAAGVDAGVAVADLVPSAPGAAAAVEPTLPVARTAPADFEVERRFEARNVEGRPVAGATIWLCDRGADRKSTPSCSTGAIWRGLWSSLPARGAEFGWSPSWLMRFGFDCSKVAISDGAGAFAIPRSSVAVDP